MKEGRSDRGGGGAVCPHGVEECVDAQRRFEDNPRRIREAIKGVLIKQQTTVQKKHICDFFSWKMIKHLIDETENKKREEGDKLNKLYIDIINY